MTATTETIRWAARSRHLRTEPRARRGGHRLHRLGIAAATTMLAVDGVLLGWALLLVR